MFVPNAVSAMAMVKRQQLNQWNYDEVIEVFGVLSQGWKPASLSPGRWEEACRIDDVELLENHNNRVLD